MFKSTFDRETVVVAQPLLHEAFQTDRIYFAPGARVTLVGEITLGPEVMLAGEIRLEGPLTLLKGSDLTNVRLGQGCTVRPYSILSDMVAGERNLLGPFCFIRDNCTVADDCIIGAHVEAARSRFASGVKVSHRAFIGDADIGESSIIGAGVVFCNFDGTGRQSTRVGPRVTVGSGSLLVPPLVIGANALIAAGSIVTKDVLAGSKIIQKR